jgi:hypothetical protein
MNRMIAAAFVCLGFAGFTHADVVLLRTPNRGIQPQALVDANGNVHLLYFVGTPANGNLMYVRRDAGKKDFATPIKVNSQDGSAIATGTIRGGHLALGKNGRVHVAWNGSMKAEPKNPIAGVPMMYARLAEDGKGFEPQRNLMTQSAVLDGGGSLAADAKGNVFVAWHALGKELVKGENNRKVWVTVSNDDGKTFAAERPAWSENTGACGCCGMRGFTDLKGTSYFLYRAASEKINRGMYVLTTADQGKLFVGQQLDNWKIETCPMSSEAFAEGPRGVVAAWDNDGQIFVAPVRNPKLAMQAPGEGGNRKHPSLAFNQNGEMLLAWTEGTGWMRGGALVWQMFDKAGKATESGRRDGAIPVWGMPAVIADPAGRFIILH